MSAHVGRVWVMPVGSVVLDRDGDQLWYATEDGTGCVTPAGLTSPRRGPDEGEETDCDLRG